MFWSGLSLLVRPQTLARAGAGRKDFAARNFQPSLEGQVSRDGAGFPAFFCRARNRGVREPGLGVNATFG